LPKFVADKIYTYLTVSYSVFTQSVSKILCKSTTPSPRHCLQTSI